MVLCGCSARAQRSAPKEPWTEGFWVWNAEWGAASSRTLDAVYVRLPQNSDLGLEKVPQARETWATFRWETRGIPPDAFLAQVRAQVDRWKQRKLRGVQFDIDSPTRLLPEYAEFLKKARTALPGYEISITALLDWFRDGTRIDAVIQQVDEFVPQFYDVWEKAPGAGIAEPLQVATYGPRFRRLGKRFRIGISTFGRGRLPWSRRLYREVTPMDIASDGRYKLTTERNVAGELVLNYSAPKGEEPVQFIVPTPEGVRGAVAQAKQMGASGVIFFRWPLEGESLVLQPEEALGVGPGVVSVEATRGDCVAVECWDLSLVRANRFVKEPLEYRIYSSVDVDYTVGSMRVVGPRELTVRVLPFAAKFRMELGRVVTSQKATFTVEVR